ncbi:ankyrin repeat-containing protein [Legionella birminghamensis]|uniref:Ankyrin repeat-containing protein n=1 Tax=Legionella birminghamensis TaxID=28083 RepID=A0A378IAR4_9GAMM|nr:Fic family protein [Legionella birminghamensis]KTC76006.1 ankyrin repeat-containing protein [Legionella birminghamensis]STX32133.1 ankyrin repeat-containing protein [Legionella birminghamensis]
MFDFFKNKSVQEALNDCISFFASFAENDLTTLRYNIPSQEVWRLFVDGCRQNGRGLIKCPMFNSKLPNGRSAMNYQSLTVKKYITEIEKCQKLEDSTLYMSVGFTLSWCLSEEEMNDLTIGDLIKLDKAWFTFELTEPGYLRAMYQAYDELFQKENTLSIATIKRIHQLATDKVANLLYDNSDNMNAKGDFRITDSSLTGINLSEQGIKEFVEELLSEHSSKQDIYLHASCGGSEGFNFTRAFFKDMEDILKNQTTRDIEHFKQYCTGDNDHEKNMSFRYLKPYLNNLLTCQSIDEVISIVHTCLKKSDFRYMQSYQPNDTQATLERTMQQFISKCDFSLSQATTPLQKLETIIDFIQSCEQLHPFSDGNTRTFSMLLLNYLLVKNGMPPTILTDPNNIILGTKQSLITDVVSGMKRFITLVNEKKLYGFNTNEFIDFISHKPSLLPRLQYFINITGQENHAKTMFKSEQTQMFRSQ